MLRFSFGVALVATQNVLSYIKGLSMKLQGCYVNAIQAYRGIQNVKSTLGKQRCDVETFHSQIYNEVTVLCQSVGIEESVPRVTNRQHNRQNLPSDSPMQ